MLQTQLSSAFPLRGSPYFIFKFVCTAARATFQCQFPPIHSSIIRHYHPLQHLPYVIDEWSFPLVFHEFSSLPASSLRHLLIVRRYFRSTWNPLNWFLNTARNSRPLIRSIASISGIPALHPLVINIYSLAK